MTLTEISTRSAARVAGLGYAAVFLLAIFANFAVMTRLVDPANPAATASNIAESAAQFRVALAAFTVVFVVDIVIAWALYVVFKPADATRSLLAAWSRLIYTVFLGVAVVFSAVALEVAARDLGAGGDIAVGVAMHAFDITWLVGLVAFGVHLILLGRIMLRSHIGPRWIPITLTIAGSAYIIDTFAHLLVADYASFADVFLALVAIPSVVGEFAFTVWLFARSRASAPTIEHEVASVEA